MCNEVDGVSLNPARDVLGVTDISNEACTTVHVGTDSASSFLVPTAGYQDLLDYLARPRLVSSGTIPVTRGTVLTWDISRTNLTTVWFPNLLTRLGGVHGIRFTTRFTLTVAATPFQQAILCQNVQYGKATITGFPYARCQNAAYVTNLPHVKQDIAETTMSVLEVPFLYPQDFMPLWSGTGTDTSTAGCVGLYALTALVPYRTVAGANAPTYKLLVSLHDVELIGSMPLAVNTVLLQSGLSAANPIIAEEKSLKPSGIMSRAATVVRMVAPHIPMLSSVGALTSNLLDAGAGVAKAFGFAKPTVVDEPKRVWRNAYIGDANVDMPSDSFVLAPFANNRLAVDALAGATEVDEMAISYVIGKYGQAFLGTFTTTDTMGTVLYGANVCPTSFWFRTNALRPSGNIALPAGSTAVTNSIALTPLAYAATFFRYWRGTMRFKFTFCKTKFHGGRVMAAYVPTLRDFGPTGILSATIPVLESSGGFPQPFSYSEIFDLKDSSTFEFEVPFVSPDPFLEVTAATGAISLTVLDPLVTSGQTSSTIDYLVEVMAGPDFQFGCPAPPMFAILDSVNPSNIVALQSGLGGVQSIGDKVTQYTMGENVESFKSLMMIPSAVAADIGAVTSSTSLFPYWFGGKVTATIPLAPTTATSGAYCRAANIAAMYAFVTGSTEHHLYSSAPNSANVTYTANIYRTDSGATASSPGDPRFRSTSCTQRIFSVDGTLHVRLPSYQKYARIPIWDGNGIANPGVIGVDLPITAGSITNHGRITVNNASATAIRIMYSRAAADDARCTTYIGPPPVALLQGSQTAEPDLAAIQF